MRLFIAALLALLAFSAAAVGASAGGPDTKRCLDWAAYQPGSSWARVLQTTTGGTFTSYEDCLAYAKHGTLFTPLAANSSSHVGSFENATLNVSGFHRNGHIVAVLLFAGGYRLATYRGTTDNKGAASIPWTWPENCATVPVIFGPPPYDARFAVSENEDGSGLRAGTPTFTAC